jgi:hypothetical protein
MSNFAVHFGYSVLGIDAWGVYCSLVILRCFCILGQIHWQYVMLSLINCVMDQIPILVLCIHCVYQKKTMGTLRNLGNPHIQ